jgi:hypothetical protein
LGVGATVTGVLVQYAPDPTRLIFGILTVLFVALAATMMVLPETVTRVAGAVAALRPEVAVPVRARRAFVGAVPTMVSTWALGGLNLSVGGLLLVAVLGQTNQALVGLEIGLFPLSAASAALLARNLLPRSMARAGGVALAVGVALFLLALGTTSIYVYVLAAVIAGAGFGCGFLGALRSVSQLAEPQERAALLSAVFVVSYVAFSVPALAAGVLATHIGLLNTSLAYGGVVALIALGTLSLEWLTDR